MQYLFNNNNNKDTSNEHTFNSSFHQVVFANGLTQLNNFATRGDVILDLVLCNEPNVICNLKTLAPLGASDHDIISFSLILSPSSHLDPKPTPLPVRNYAKCNFDLINFDLNQVDWTDIFSNCDTVDDFWSTFLIIIIDDSLDSHCPYFAPVNRIKKIE